MTVPLVSVCIPTVRPTTLGCAIASVLRQTSADWELLVLGQGDAVVLRSAVERAAAGDPRVRYVHLRRAGLSAARNAALRHARGELLAFTDDDCEARDDWLATATQSLEDDPELGLVGGSLRGAPAPDGRRGPAVYLRIEPEEVRYDPRATPPPAPPGFVWVGGNFVLRRAAAELIGPFDELLGQGAPFREGEDADYSLRAEAAGVPMLCTPRSVVVHTHGRRYGMRTMLRYWTGQGRGRGAIAAKLAMRGDSRAGDDLRLDLARVRARLAERRPARVPADAVRVVAAVGAYRHCIAHYRLDRYGVFVARPGAGG